MGDASIVSAHYSVWDSEPALMESYRKLGFCLTVYDIEPHQAKDYPSAHYQVIKVKPDFPAYPSGVLGGDYWDEFKGHDGDQTGFWLLVLVAVACVPLCVICGKVSISLR